MAAGWALALCMAAAIACGGQNERFPDDVVWNVTISRADQHPTYGCTGTVDTRADSAAFSCDAEQLSSWTVSGPVEQFRLADTLRLWIHDGAIHGMQPAIAIDLEQYQDRLRGWATVVLPDGSGSGHFDAVAEASLAPGH